MEAPGYEPFSSESYGALTNGLVVRLQPGAGPNGIVLTPGGEPATNATVYYGAAGEQFGLNDASIGCIHGVVKMVRMGATRRPFRAV
ncbi:MAG: hypothetical protein MUC91_07660 [Verrucomicrobia bacterium]|nr:hypothetical protein [Verrucomicrobiota bacterium]